MEILSVVIYSSIISRSVTLPHFTEVVFLKTLQLFLCRTNVFPFTISGYALVYLETKILCVLSSVSGDFLTRSLLKARSLSSIWHSTSRSTWRHGSAGSYCCHNKSATDRIQYNHASVPFHSTSVEHFSKLYGACCTPHRLPYPQCLMVDLRGIIHGR